MFKELGELNFTSLARLNSHTLEILFLQCYRFLPVRQHTERNTPTHETEIKSGSSQQLSSWHRGTSFPSFKPSHSIGRLCLSLGFY